MKNLFCILLLVVLSVFLSAQSTDITQIENRRLLLDGTLDLYFLPRDGDGKPRTIGSQETMELFSLDADGKRSKRRILSVEQQAPRSQGIQFLLLIDNSGSMHDEKLDGVSRYETALFAVREFLQNMDNPLDRVGIGSFNTWYTPLIGIGTVSAEHTRSLEKIKEPARAESFTELYRSAIVASADLASFSGRRAMIILSDGENYPFALSGSPHPEYGLEMPGYEEVVEAMREEGITVYAVHIGDARDKLLDTIALETGGRSFSAGSREELRSVYGSIRDEIRQEYRLRFRPPYSRYEINSLVLNVGGNEAEARYSVPHFLGLPAAYFSLWFLFPLCISALIAALLPFMVWEHAADEAEINLLSSGGRFSPSTRVHLTREVTVIGSGSRADMTVAGNPALRESHATIVFDKGSGNYTVQAEGEFRVNNRITKQQTLKSGDVIDLEGTTIVFDKPK
jgi:Ca-activated chloride channel homolog